MGKKNDVFQVVILTLFMVSAFLFVLSLYFSSERGDALAQVNAAIFDYKKLAKDLKETRLREALKLERERKEAEGKKELWAEVQSRVSTELPGLPPLQRYKPQPDKTGNYNVHYVLIKPGAGQKQATFAADTWVKFFVELERDRPDIHLDSATFETKEIEVTSSEKRKWTCDAKLVLWEPKQK